MMDAGFFLDLVKSIPDGNFPRLYKTIYENPNLDSCKPSLWRAVAEAYKEIGNLDAYKYCLKKADKLAIMVSAWGSFGNKDYIKFFYCLENRPEKGIFLSELKELYPEIQVQNWIGQVDKSATIYIRFKGGYGDVIMFIRYLPLVKKCCKKLIFACHSSLIPLFEENPQLGIDVLVDKALKKKIHFDYYAELLSMPYALSLNSEEIFVSSTGYLEADALKSTMFKQKYCNLNNKFKIGFKWCGNAKALEQRIVPIESYFKILDIPNTQFYSMQTDDGYEELKKCGTYDVIDLGKDFKDFSDTAAAVDNMDLIIVNDTSLVHLAGAMGKPTFLLLPYDSEWRWGKEESKSPWYDSVKIFKQTTEDDWDEVMDRVRFELINLFKRL